MLALFYGVYLVLLCEALHYHDMGKLLGGYVAGRFSVFITMCLLVSALYGALILLTRRVGVAAGVLGLFFYVFGTVSHFKQLILEENLYPWDFYMLRNAGQMASFVDIGPSIAMVLLFFTTLFYVGFLTMGGRALKFKAYARFPAGLLVLAGLILYAITPYSRFTLMPLSDLQVNDTVMQQVNYDKNGLIGAFLLNIGNLNVPAPDGYSEEMVGRVLSEYEGSGVSEEFLYPDVLVVMSESFFDVNGLGVSYSKDPMEPFYTASSGQYAKSGDMVSPTLGGGTVRTEFEVLTGLTISGLPAGSVPYQQYLNKPVWTYASLFSDLGYGTYAYHTNTKTFYDRDKGYAYMGFDAFYGSEDLEEQFAFVPIEKKAGNISDETFAKYMFAILSEKRRGDAPMFIYGITMENHQSYVNKYQDEELALTASSNTLDESGLDIAENIGQGIYDANLCLESLTAYVDSAKRPTVLLFFGDHLPTLGESQSLMAETGFIGGGEGERADTYKMYTPPYLLYANFKLKDDAFAKDGAPITSYNMLNYLCDEIGAPYTDYMAFLRDFYSCAPIYTPVFQVDKDGRGSDLCESFYERHLLFSYDRIVGKGYSERDGG